MKATQFGDKYRLVEHIATGGMAEIYRAQYTGIEGFAKELVVKRLREEYARRSDVVAMFLDEAKVAATLTHNNIVHTYDLGEMNGEYYIAMELLKGEELVGVLRRGVMTDNPLYLAHAVGIIQQTLEGLHYAHEHRQDGEAVGIVHRDMNPTNIYVGYDGVCKIVDFGIALTRNIAKRGTSQFAGKLSYMAPEQMREAEVDRRADIYPIGVMLYELTLRRRLFRGSPEEVRKRVLEGDIPAPTFVDPQFSPELEAIILRALATDPADRYQNCDHMFRDLDAYLKNSGQSWTPRELSAYMAELFGEGAPAVVDYEDEYNDVVQDVLELDDLDALLAKSAKPEAHWAELEVPSAKPENPRRRRAMTLGSIAALVDDLQVQRDKERGPERDPNRHPRRTPSPEELHSLRSSPRQIQPEMRPVADSGDKPILEEPNPAPSRPSPRPGAAAKRTPSLSMEAATPLATNLSPTLWVAVVGALCLVVFLGWRLFGAG